jgi:hypothetical protein
MISTNFYTSKKPIKTLNIVFFIRKSYLAKINAYLPGGKNFRYEKHIGAGFRRFLLQAYCVFGLNKKPLYGRLTGSDQPINSLVLCKDSRLKGAGGRGW